MQSSFVATSNISIPGQKQTTAEDFIKLEEDGEAAADAPELAKVRGNQFSRYVGILISLSTLSWFLLM